MDLHTFEVLGGGVYNIDFGLPDAETVDFFEQTSRQRTRSTKSDEKGNVEKSKETLSAANAIRRGVSAESERNVTEPPRSGKMKLSISRGESEYGFLEPKAKNAKRKENMVTRGARIWSLR